MCYIVLDPYDALVVLIRVGTFSELGKDEIVGTIAESRIESRGRKERNL